MKSAQARIPESISLPSTTAELDPSAIILNDGLSKFVFVQLELGIEFEDKKSFKLMMNEFSAKVGDEVHKPIADAKHDGRHLDIYRDINREYERLSKFGKSENEARPASISLVFYFEPTDTFSIMMGDQSVDVTPVKVTRLEDLYVPNVTVNEASLQKQFQKSSPQSIPQIPKFEQTVVPLGGSVLRLSLQVVPKLPNASGTSNQFNLTPSDFRLMDGNQVIPMYKLVGRRSLMRGSIFTIGMDDERAREMALLEGEPAEPGTEIELLYLVDPTAAKWDIYFGAHKVAEISHQDLKHEE
ncbi:hypothetical protein P0Y35_18385 [Kiritimatiellaeota bacterium B1221]|nr:hypothetical protein [Kiritimatiellaeota bacterium B1221]